MRKFFLAGLFICIFVFNLFAQDEKSSAKENVLKTVNLRLNQELKQVEKENQDIRNALRELKNKIKDLETDRGKVLDKLTKITKENTHLQSENAILQNQINKQKQDFESQDSIVLLREKEASLSALAKELELGKEKEKTTQEKFSFLQKEKTKLGLEISRLENEIIALRQDKKVSIKNNRALASRLEDSLKELLRSYNTFLFLTKDMTNTYYNLGVLLQETGRGKEAIIEFEKVISLNPLDINSHFNLALLYDTVVNDRNKAITHFQRYLALNPAASDALTVKERLTELKSDRDIWEHPELKNLEEVEKDLGRWR